MLGKIYLDPASDSKHQQRIQALKYFNKEDDGISKEWNAKTVFLNPPYSASTKWIAKAIEEFEAGRAKELIILIHADTKTKWWHSAFSKCSAVCFTQGVIKFHHPAQNTTNSAPMGSHIFYFGPNAEKFAEVFKQLGTAIRNTWSQGANHHDNAIIIKGAKCVQF